MTTQTYTPYKTLKIKDKVVQFLKSETDLIPSL